MPWTWRTGSGQRAVCGTGATTKQCRDARIQSMLDLLWADEMNVSIDATGSHDLALGCNDFGAGSDDDVNARLDVGIASFAYCADPPVADANVGLHDTPVIENDCIGDHGVNGAGRAAQLALTHAVTDDLTAAELYLLTVN